LLNHILFPGIILLDKSAVKKKLLIIAGLLAIASVIIIAVFAIKRSPDAVVYDGKSIRTWALQMNANDEHLTREAMAQFQALGSNAVPGLTVLLGARDSFLRKGIWSAALKMPAAIRNVVTTKVRAPDSARIRSAAARSLAAVGGDAQGAVPSLARMLEEDEAQCRMQAAFALGNIGGCAVRELIKASESKDLNIRYAAVYGFGNVRPPDDVVVLALLKATGDANSGIAIPAGTVLSKIGTNALPAVMKALESPEMQTRRQATRALATIRAPRDEMVPLLLKMLKDREPACRVQAAQVLGTSGLPNPTMVAGLVGALDDSATEVRVAAIQGLRQGHRMAARALPDLLRCLDDSSPLVRQSAAEALGAFGTQAKPALPRLIQAADDQEEKVRVAATGAISSIKAQEGTN
jgi:HEAT repeat protein